MIVPVVGIITLILMVLALSILARRARTGNRQEGAYVGAVCSREKSVDELRDILQKGKTDEKVAAIEELARMDVPERAQLLVEALGARNEQVRLAAKEALTQTRDEAAVPLLIEAMRDPEKWLPARVAEILMAIGQPAINPVLKAAEDEDNGVRAYALQILGMLDMSTALPALEKALEDPSVEVRRAASQVVAEHLPAQLLMLMLKLCKDEDAKVRLQAVKAVATLNNEDAVAVLEGAARDEDWGVAATAVGALNRLGEKGKTVLRGIALDRSHPANKQAVAFVGEQKSNNNGVSVNISFGRED